MNSQTSYIGNWEGVFMNDFKVEINFNTNNQNQIEGNIKMFAGENIIQDDKIESVNQSVNQLTFYIPAKETLFKGSFNGQLTELSGDFIFPDGSKHAIQLNKSLEETNSVEEFKKLKEQQFNADELNSDLEFLYTNLKKYHPQLYTHTSKDSMDILVEKLKSEIDTTLTLEEFYVLASKLTDALHCSHTGVKLPSTYQNLANRLGNYFPLRLFFSNGKAFYVTGCVEEDDQILPGQEIISINGVPVNQLIEQAFYFIPSEACNKTTKYNELNKSFNTLFYLLDNSEEFEVKFNSGVSNSNITVASSSLADINCDCGTNENSREVNFSLINNKSIGLLKVSSFAIPEMDRYFHQLDSIFSNLKTNNIQNLILDLRENSGGHPIFAAQLFSYLTDKDFIYFKRNEGVKDFEPLYNTMQSNKLNFNGSVYVFIDGGCLSTTGHLISLLKFYTNAIFIGEEPGSTFRCNDLST
ncbi:MAG: S41 family peptidase, partial [Flavobacteriaceae bacterium]|nr:S41 family peptidase [Flavobacteriaceae bacterium]